MSIVVIKRDGRKKPFDSKRIELAVSKALTSFGAELATKMAELPEKVAENVEIQVIKLSCKLEEESSIFIETVQDLVVAELKKYSPELSNSYAKYRAARSEERTRRSEEEQYRRETLEATNLDNDNANVNQYSFGGKKYRTADNDHKGYALRNLISKDVKEEFNAGGIYIHDLASYSIGDANCLFIDFDTLLANGFKTRNCDVRSPNSIATAMQLVAVIFQCQSQNQYGGVASQAIDFELAPYVAKSFKNHFRRGIEDLGKYIYSPEQLDVVRDIEDTLITMQNSALEVLFPEIHEYAVRHLEREGKQAAEGLYHNLGTLESRPGSQLPFTSINFGRDTSIEGRLVTKWLLNASIEGVGEHKKTSIFPISIFQRKKGVNDKPGTPNYDLMELAIESLSKRIYPNIVNCDWSSNIEDPDDKSTFMATMGCRTMIGKDIHTDSYSKVGRGNISPVTIILTKLGLDYGIALGKREDADVEGFLKALDDQLLLTRKALIERYNYIVGQDKKSAPFMYENGTIMKYDRGDHTVEEAMKHGTNGIGILDMAGCCKALFGKHHGEDEEVYEFALNVVKRISDFCDTSSEEFNMNFSLYYTPKMLGL